MMYRWILAQFVVCGVIGFGCGIWMGERAWDAAQAKHEDSKLSRVEREYQVGAADKAKFSVSISAVSRLSDDRIVAEVSFKNERKLPIKVSHLEVRIEDSLGDFPQQWTQEYEPAGLGYPWEKSDPSIVVENGDIASTFHVFDAPAEYEKWSNALQVHVSYDDREFYSDGDESRHETLTWDPRFIHDWQGTDSSREPVILKLKKPFSA